MKISIAWIFDHIDADYRTIDIANLMQKLNEITAEIEHEYAVSVDLSNLSLAQLTATTNECTVLSVEWDTKMTLPKRADAKEGRVYLIAKEGKKYRWATTLDFGGQKEMLLPAMNADKKMLNGGWKKSFEAKDHIFEVDNKSITNRPDLWGHRGFAREVAAILNLKLKPIEQFCADISVTPCDDSAAATDALPFSITRKDTQGCKRFAGLYVPSVAWSPSLLWMASRLARVDSRSIDALVDCTNYVMLDTSQPMHAFDADTLSKHAIVARRAQNKETLVLLDDQKIELTEHDIVIADGQHPVALAGIMGGKATAVTDRTNSLFLEAANFDASTIRKSSLAHKVRTEASARFEKTLDPNQNILALTRYVALLKENGIECTVADQIHSLGPVMQSPKIEIEQSFIQKAIGTSIAPAFIKDTLEKLEFGVQESRHKDDALCYEITVPTFRATKDVTIKEDIVEEVARFYGYDQIPLQLPYLQTKPSSLHATMQQYRIKQILAFGLSMRELYTYSFFDESFIAELGWQPEATAQVKDPVSQNWHRLVTTLSPALLKAVHENYIDHDELRFFEWARTWHQQQDITEKKVLAGILYNKHGMNFYDAKAQLSQLFTALSLKVNWQPISETPYPWFDQQQTATIEHEGRLVGIAGMTDNGFFKKIASGSAFIFELDAQLLSEYQKPLTRFEPLPKYPAIDRDVTVMASLALSVAELSTLIKNVDGTITSVRLMDMFAKKEWKDARALTFRYIMRNADRTMTKDEAEAIDKRVIKALEAVGATIR